MNESQEHLRSSLDCDALKLNCIPLCFCWGHLEVPRDLAQSTTCLADLLAGALHLNEAECGTDSELENVTEHY